MPRGGGTGTREECELVSRGRRSEPRSGPARGRHENNSLAGRGAGAALGRARLKEIRGLRRDGRGAAAGRLRGAGAERSAGERRPRGPPSSGRWEGATQDSPAELAWIWGLGVRR